MMYPLFASDLGPPVLGPGFNQGYQSGRGPMSPGLEAQGERWSEMGRAAATQPNSVLSQLSPSPIAANLSAPSQRDRLLPNGFQLSNYANGASAPTSQTVTSTAIVSMRTSFRISRRMADSFILRGARGLPATCATAST